MKEMILLKQGEMVLKGQNRPFFEKRLIQNIKRRLANAGIAPMKITSAQSAIYLEPAEGDAEKTLDVVSRVFGIASIGRAAVCAKDIDEILAVSVRYLKEPLSAIRRFKVEAKRSDKRFPLTSLDISKIVGGHLHDAFPHLVPDMHEPEEIVRVEIRDQHAFVYCGKQPGAGGLPVGVNGKAGLLLSGGIDSPVAGHMMAKRGAELHAIHFFSYPYTSEQSLDKVRALASIVSRYSGRITLHVVPFTAIQEKAVSALPGELFTIVIRRAMMRIAERIAKQNNLGALITGESLGQVASQTMAGLRCTDSACDAVVFRPLIGMDKEEIVTRARAIGTFETSILPYEDCCTVFMPKHPKIHPKLEDAEEAERLLPLEELIGQAVLETKSEWIEEGRSV